MANGCPVDSHAIDLTARRNVDRATRSIPEILQIEGISGDNPRVVAQPDEATGGFLNEPLGAAMKRSVAMVDVNKSHREEPTA
jgi:hypothetical protein